MKIEVGKKYRRRDGTVVEIAGFTPMGHPNASLFPFITEGEGGYTYAVDGRYVGFVESEFDLVEEIPDDQSSAEPVEGAYVDVLRESLLPGGPIHYAPTDTAQSLQLERVPRDIAAITAIEQAMRGLDPLHEEAVTAWFRARYPEAPF